MGLSLGLLSKPITDKYSDDAKNDKIAYGCSCMQGWRDDQEDAHNCILDFDDGKFLFAVYDGHGGSEVAEYCSQHLPDYIKETPEYKSENYEQALISAFLGFDDTLLDPVVNMKLRKLVVAGYERRKLIKKKNFGAQDKKYETDDKELDVDEEAKATSSDGVEDEECEIKHLYKEAEMPLEEVIDKVFNENSAVILKNIVDKANSLHRRSNETNTSGEVSSSTSSTTAVVPDANGAVNEDAQKEAASTTDLEKDETSVPSISKEEKKESEIEITNGPSEPDITIPVVNGDKDGENDDALVNDTNEQVTNTEECKKPTRITPHKLKDSSPASSPNENLWKLFKKKMENLQQLDDSDESDQEFDPSECGEPKDEETSEDDDETASELDSEETDEVDDCDEEQDINEEEADEKGISDEQVDENDEEDIEDRDPVAFNCGCTVCVALVTEDSIYVANAGDSRCVASVAGEALELSHDHKPRDKLEYARIKKAGGRVSDGRVDGGLNLSRAIGDHCYKMCKELPNTEQKITALPDILSCKTADVEFLVLACDGIWNSMTNQEVIDFVRPKLNENRPISKICEELFDHCLAPNTLGDGTGCDNMTCIIAKFLNTPFATSGITSNTKNDGDHTSGGSTEGDDGTHGSTTETGSNNTEDSNSPLSNEGSPVCDSINGSKRCHSPDNFDSSHVKHQKMEEKPQDMGSQDTTDNSSD